MTDQHEEVVRGCGIRVAGGIYLTVKQSQDGKPISAFLTCPPRPVDAAKLGLSPRGVTLVRDDRTGVHHVMDWVGMENYPNVADMVEETRRFGVSRRVAKSLDFSLLSPASRLMLVHSRASLDNADDYRRIIAAEVAASQGQAIPTTPFHCPRMIPEHASLEIDGEPNPAMCASLWYEDIDDASPVLDPRVPFRTVERRVGSTVYRARHRPYDLIPQYRLAVFAIFPIHGIEVVRDAADGTHEDAYQKASAADLSVDIVDR